MVHVNRTANGNSASDSKDGFWLADACAAAQVCNAVDSASGKCVLPETAGAACSVADQGEDPTHVLCTQLSTLDTCSFMQPWPFVPGMQL